MDFIDIALILSYTLVVLAAIASIAFPIISAVGEPKVLKKTGMGIGGLLIVFLLAWAMSGSETAPYLEFEVGEGLSKFIGGSIIMMYLLIIGALGAIVYTELSKAIK